jgi:hypothetical protein
MRRERHWTQNPLFVTVEDLPCRVCPAYHHHHHHHAVEQWTSRRNLPARRAGQTAPRDRRGHCGEGHPGRRRKLWHFVRMRSTSSTRCMCLGTSTAVSTDSGGQTPRQHKMQGHVWPRSFAPGRETLIQIQ